MVSSIYRIVLAAIVLFLPWKEPVRGAIDSLHLEKIEKKYGPFAAARFRYLNELFVKLRDANLSTKLEEVNAFWNGVRYGSDRKVWGKRDYWATPFEFLLKDRGDCEDYVIAKYFTLKKLGIESDKLFFVYVRVKGYKKTHMVLAYFQTPDADPLILDNLNLRIFPASRRKDIEPVYTFNGELLKRYADGSHRNMERKSRKLRQRWDDLILRMQRNEI